MNVFTTKQPSKIYSNTMLRSSFLAAGVLFALVCLIGFITKLMIDAAGVTIASDRFSTEMFSSDNANLQTLKVVLGIGGFAIIASAICSVIWSFRFFKTSKTFIVVNYVLFALGQGVGFGILFSVFGAFELIGIFGIAGAIFGAMGMVGFVIKDGTRLMPFMITGMIAVAVMSLVSVILYFAGIYSDTLIMMMVVFTGILTCLYIVFDVWYIRMSEQYAQASGVNNEEMRFRIVAFFGFRLASDLISLIWTIARLYLRTRD